MPVCWLLTTLTSNPPLYAAPFWTFSCLLAASTSNPPLSRSPFGLHPAYLLPSHHSNVQFATLCRSLLDFTLPIYWLPTASTSNPPYSRSPFGLHPAYLLPSHHFSVQSAILSLSFWTSSCLFVAFPPLQRPIRHTLALLLDFILPSHHSNVQFATLHLGVRTFTQKTLDFQTQIYT